MSELQVFVLAAEAAGVDAAADRLAAGGLVAFPTETVYGLGARADDDDAVARIYAAKGRPADHPLIVHVASTAAARRFAAALPAVAERLIERCWPGPLTVVVPRADGIATAAAGGQPTIGLRRPAHALAQRLLDAAAARGVHGIAAPSANRFGRLSPTEARHVVDEFAGRAALAVLDGGPCEVGIESAIVDCSRGRPVLLRPGALTRAELGQAAGEPIADRDAEAPRASGTLAAHYAPRAALRLVAAADLPGLAAALGGSNGGAAVYCRTLPAPPAGPGGIAWRRMPDDAARAAHELFAVLRELDATGVRLICVEAPPDAPAWDGVRDRLQRAAAAS